MADNFAAACTIVHLVETHIWRNHGRGLRSDVAASRQYRPGHARTTALNHYPHYMDIANGAALWQETETRHADMLRPQAETQLIEVLALRLTPPQSNPYTTLLPFSSNPLHSD